MVVLAEKLSTEEANLYTDIYPGESNCCMIYDDRGQM